MILDNSLLEKLYREKKQIKTQTKTKEERERAIIQSAYDEEGGGGDGT